MPSNVSAFSVSDSGSVAAIVAGDVWVWGMQEIPSPTQITNSGGFSQVSMSDDYGLAVGPGNAVFRFDNTVRPAY